MVTAPLFLLGVALSVLASKIPIVVLGIYVSVSVLTFIVYALDKSAAKRDAWRTPESTMHLLSVLCGWPGAIVAQEMLRHKSSKASFRVVFWITVVLNCSVFTWLFTRKGAAALNTLLSNF